MERGPHLPPPSTLPPSTPLKDFLGRRVYSRIGIAAGLLMNSRWLRDYAARGFDLLTYKTVRTRAHPCHPPPNWVFVEEGDEPGGPMFALEGLPSDPALVNSAACFGMPSAAPEFWREDVMRAKEALQPGQLLLVSVAGSAQLGWDAQRLAADYAQCAAWAADAGADVIEANLLAPALPSGNGAVFRDIALSRLVAQRIQEAIGPVPLLLKVGNPDAEHELAALLRAVAGAAQGVTLSSATARRVLHRDGRPYFGAGHEVVGVQGRIHFPASVAAVRRARHLLEREGLGLTLAAVGGVASVADAAALFAAGADAVLMGSAPMYLPDLAAEMKRAHPEW